MEEKEITKKPQKIEDLTSKSKTISKLETENDLLYIENSNKIALGDYNQAPDYLKDNEYIKKGYRLNCNTLPKVFRSLFMCHNETINIWSHLLGAFLAVCFIIYSAAFISFNKEVLMSLVDYEAMIKEIKQITHPWITILEDYDAVKRDQKESNSHMIQTIHSLKICTYEFLTEITSQKNVTSKFDSFFEQSGKALENERQALKSDIFYESLKEEWIKLKNKLIDVLNGELFNYNEGNSLSESSVHGNQLRKWPLFIMLGSAIICLSSSSIFHWIGALSAGTYQILSRFDYAGISILIAGSCYPPYFYFFYCERFLAIVYLSFISIFAITVFFFTLSPDFHVPKRRRLRGTLFLTLGISTAIPILHLAFFGKYVNGFEKSPHLIFWYLGGISYVTGALIYIQRIPEKCRPGKHDIFGASHQIFHLLVVVGVVLHYLGSVDSYYYRAENACPKLL